MADVQIITGYTPGSIGRVAELHANYYQQHWGFGLFFEAKVATELAAFLGRYMTSSETVSGMRWCQGVSRAQLPSTAPMPQPRAHICVGSSCLMRYWERASVIS